MLRPGCVLLLVVGLWCVPAFGADAPAFDWRGDLSVRMMDGLHTFIERKISGSREIRPRLCQTQCDRLTDTLRCAGYDCDLFLQSKT